MLLLASGGLLIIKDNLRRIEILGILFEEKLIPLGSHQTGST